MRNLTRHWLTGHALGARQGEIKWAEAVLLPGKISFVSQVAYGLEGVLLSLSHGGLQLLKPGRVVPNSQYWSYYENKFY